MSVDPDPEVYMKGKAELNQHFFSCTIDADPHHCLDPAHIRSVFGSQPCFGVMDPAVQLKKYSPVQDENGYVKLPGGLYNTHFPV